MEWLRGHAREWVKTGEIETAVRLFLRLRAAYHDGFENGTANGIRLTQINEAKMEGAWLILETLFMAYVKANKKSEHRYLPAHLLDSVVKVGTELWGSDGWGLDTE